MIDGKYVSDVSPEDFRVYCAEKPTAVLRSKLFLGMGFHDRIIETAMGNDGWIGGEQYSQEFMTSRKQSNDEMIEILRAELEGRDEMPEAMIMTRNGVKTMTREEAIAYMAEAEKPLPEPQQREGPFDQVVRLKTLTMDGSAPAAGS